MKRAAEPVVAKADKAAEGKRCRRAEGGGGRFARDTLALRNFGKDPAKDQDGDADAPYWGVYSVLGAATGRSGKSVWDHSANKGADMLPPGAVRMGYVTEGRQKTPVVLPRYVPALLVAKLSRAEALCTLTDPSLGLESALVELGGLSAEEARVIVLRAAEPLREELEDCARAMARILHGEGASSSSDGPAAPRLRCRRVPRPGGQPGETVLLISALDLVILAKRCSYTAAKQIYMKLLKEYFGADEEAAPTSSTSEVCSSDLTRATRFEDDAGTNGGGSASVALELERAAEFFMLIPGSELSAASRRRAADVMLRVDGGDVSLIDRILANRKFQSFLQKHDANHPMRAFGEYAERRGREEAENEETRRANVEQAAQAVEETHVRKRLLELQLREAEAKTKEAEAKADEAAAVASARRQSFALQHYTETQVQTAARVEAAGSAMERLRNILPRGTIESAAGRMADTLVTIATSHPKTDEDYGAPLRLVQFLVDELKCDEAWAFKKVPFFGRCAKEEVDKDFPGVVFPRTRVRYNGQDYDVHQYYDAQKPALRRAMPRFLAKHPRPMPVGRDIGSFLLRRPTAPAGSSTGPADDE